MIRDIKIKLSETLSQERHTEQSVTYAFVEMRKILEKEEVKSDFPLICFYADWVVHSFLSGKDAQQKLREIGKIFSGNPEADKEVDITVSIYPFISFSKLKDELFIFFTKYTLPKVILDDSHWYSFLDYLINILSDSPLKMKDENSLIREFVFKPQMTNGDVIFEITLNNGLFFSTVTNFNYLVELK